AENGLAADTPVPVDAVTASASGLDPDISPANAQLQLKRVATQRHMSESQLADLLHAHTSGRLLGLLGEPRVNVLKLNLALDAQQSPAVAGK
ncbi:MAG: potassium-transporting ATPase subunit C, partial [Luteimonas sp.]|nr:potassium-transporting ATPase subunit C [Luteimonas sp.]